MKFEKLCRINYNENTDSFELLITTDKDEWGVVLIEHCQASETDSNRDYIHFQIINELRACVDMGYRFIG